MEENSARFSGGEDWTTLSRKFDIHTTVNILEIVNGEKRSYIGYFKAAVDNCRHSSSL